MIRFGYGRSDSDETEDAFTTEQGNVVLTAVTSGPSSRRESVVRARPEPAVPDAPTSSRSPAQTRGVIADGDDMFDRRISISTRNSIAIDMPVVGIEMNSTRGAPIVPSMQAFECEREVSTESAGSSGTGAFGFLAGRARSVSEHLSAQTGMAEEENIFDRRPRPVASNASQDMSGRAELPQQPERQRQDSTKSSASGNSRYDLRGGRTKSVSEMLSQAQFGSDDLDAVPWSHTQRAAKAVDAQHPVNREDTLKASIVSMRSIQMSKDSDVRESSDSAGSARYKSQNARGQRTLDRTIDGAIDSPSSLIDSQSTAVSRGEHDERVIRSSSHHRIDQASADNTAKRTTKGNHSYDQPSQGVRNNSDSRGTATRLGYGKSQAATTTEFIRDDYRTPRNGQFGSQKLSSSRPRQDDRNDRTKRNSSKDSPRKGQRNQPAADRYVDISDDDDDSEHIVEHRNRSADRFARGNLNQYPYVGSGEEDTLIEQRARKEGIPKNILSMMSVRKSYEGLNDDYEVALYRDDVQTIPMVPLIVKNVERSERVGDEHVFGDPLGSGDIDSETLFWGGGGMSSLISTEDEPNASVDLRTQMFRRSRMNSLTSEDGELRSYSAYQSNERNASNASSQQSAPERKERHGNASLSPHDILQRGRVVTKSEGDLLRKVLPEARSDARRRSESRKGALSRDSQRASHLLHDDHAHGNRKQSERTRENRDLLDRDKRRTQGKVKEHYFNDSTVDEYTDDSHYQRSLHRDHSSEMARHRDKPEPRRRKSLRHHEHYDDDTPHSSHRRAQDTSKRDYTREEPMERPRNNSRNETRISGSRSSTHSGDHYYYTGGNLDHEVPTIHSQQKFNGDRRDHEAAWNGDTDRGRYDSHRNRLQEIPRSRQSRHESHQRDLQSYDEYRSESRRNYSSSSGRYTPGGTVPEKDLSRRSSAEPGGNFVESEEALDQNSPPEEESWLKRNMSMSIRLSDM